MRPGATGLKRGCLTGSWPSQCIPSAWLPTSSNLRYNSLLLHRFRFVLPADVASAAFLSPEERQALQEELGRHQHRISNSSGDVEGGSSAATSAHIKGQGHPEQLQQQEELSGNGSSSRLPPLPLQQHQRRRRLSEDWASFRHALRCPIVWCSGVWRMLYACAIYGLTYFVPLIIKTILNKVGMGGEGTMPQATECGCAALWQCALCCLCWGCTALHSQSAAPAPCHTTLHSHTFHNPSSCMLVSGPAFLPCRAPRMWRWCC